MWIYTITNPQKIINTKKAQAIGIYDSREMKDEKKPFLIYVVFENGARDIIKSFGTEAEAINYLQHLADILSNE